MRNIESVLSWLTGEVQRRADITLERASDDEGAEGHKLGLVIIGISVNLADVDKARKGINLGAAGGDVAIECALRTTLPENMMPVVLDAVALHLKLALGKRKG